MWSGDVVGVTEQGSKTVWWSWVMRAPSALEGPGKREGRGSETGSGLEGRNSFGGVPAAGSWELGVGKQPVCRPPEEPALPTPGI